MAAESRDPPRRRPGCGEFDDRLALDEPLGPVPRVLDDVAGLLVERSWRLAWLVLPLTAAVLATTLLLLAAPRASERPSASTGLRTALTNRIVERWGLAELLFNCGWSGTLVYAGTLFAESYDSLRSAIGLILGGASVFVAGTLLGRRLAVRQPHRQLVAMASLLSALVTAFGAVRLGTWASAALFVVAGVALAAGGYAALGIAMGSAFAGAAASLVELRIGLAPVGALHEA